jgi:hypothetical protein
VAYRLEIPPLDNLYAVRAALSDIAQALASGQLEARVAGKLLYVIQQVSATNRRIEQMEAAQLEASKDAVPQVRAPQLGANLGSEEPGDSSRVQEYPDFEKQLGLTPGADLDAETELVLQQADDEARLRKPDAMPTPPPGVRVGSLAYRVFREEAYTAMRFEIQNLRHDLRDYHQQKREQLKKEVMSSFPAPARRSDRT